MKRQPGTQRARRYYQRLRSNPKACPGGDCLCDRHEGVTTRLKSRAVQNRNLPDFGEEYDEYQSEVVWAPAQDDIRFYESRLDYAYDAGIGCGDWCPCGSNLEYWMDFLRTQELYPPEPVLNPVLRAYEDN